MEQKNPYLLGIDLGTTYLKVMVLDREGRVIAEGRRSHETLRPEPDYYEQDPEEWWNNLQVLIREVISELDDRSIAAISFSGQMHGLVLVDEAGDPVVPSIIWEDKRARDVSKHIEEKLGWQSLREVVGNRPMPGFTLPKLLWVKRNLPEVYQATHKVLLPKGFLRYKLTEHLSMEITDASSGLLIDIWNRIWAKEVLNTLDLDMETLPKLVQSTDKAGEVTSKAAKLTGLQQGTPVIAGAGDQQAGAVGGGITSEGVVSATIGTGGQVYSITDELKVDPRGRVHTFCHCFPGEWHVMGAMKTAGRALEWLKNEVLSPANLGERRIDFKDLDDLARRAEPGSDGLVFLPYLAGERTPHLNPRASGLFFGLTLGHGLPEVVRSVMEGVSFNMRYALELLLGLGLPARKLRLEGGGVKSSIWPRIQADVFNRELLVTRRQYDKSAYGAAVLAGIGAGIFSEARTTVKRSEDNVLEDKITPDKSTTDIYRGNYQLFKKLYPAVEDLYRLSEN